MTQRSWLVIGMVVFDGLGALLLYGLY